MDCITQPLEPNDFVLLKKKNRAIFCSADPIGGPVGYNTIFLRKRLTFWAFCFPKTQDPAVIDPTDIDN